MNIVLLGAAGFICTNLAVELSENYGDKIALVNINVVYVSKLLDVCIRI